MAGVDAANRRSRTGGSARYAAADGHYVAFISYSHRDEAWATWLHKALETYRVPSRLVGQTTAHGKIPRRLLPIFRDRDELASATDLSSKVNAALAQSANLIVVCSPDSAQSRWVNEEILAFKRLGKADRVFCLIVGGEPNATDLPGGEAEECFAPALRFQLDADGRPTSERAEPIAADARQGKDGKPNARLKLIAGMLDVGFDALKQRELQRRNRRMAAIMAAALIVMAITTALAITAVVARHDAERRQSQAEDLVNFMLGDLNDKLSEVHRLDIMQAVDDKAMDYFASLQTKDVTDAVLEQRVIALEKIGSVRADQGHLRAALESYRAASTLAAELARRAPNDPKRQAAYADSLKWVGQSYWFQGELDNALRTFRIAGDILQKASAAKADDADLAFKLAAIYNDAGRVLEARGELAEAKRNYEATKTILGALAARDPDNRRWQSYLASAENNLGKIALEQGSLVDALKAYRTDQRIKAALSSRDPDDHNAQEKLVLSSAILGRTLGLCGELQAALRYTEQAVSSARHLATFDPNNPVWQELQALYGQQQGRLLRQLGQFHAAAEADERAVRKLQELASASPAYVDFQQELAQSQLEQARLLLHQDRTDAAKGAVRSASAVLATLYEKKPHDRRLLLLMTQARLLSGSIAAARKDDPAARAAWIKAREQAASLAHGSSDPNVLAALASAELLLGSRQAAAPIVRRLQRMGYRDADFVALVTGNGDTYPVDADAARRVAEAVE